MNKKKMYFVTDRLTATGLELAGLKTIKVADDDTINAVLKEVAEKEEMIIVTHQLYQHAGKTIERLKKKGTAIVEMPDMGGGGEESINKVIKDVVGFELKD